MTSINLTSHAEARFSQRSIRQEDLTLLLRIGTEAENGVVLLERDFNAFERDLKKLLQRLRRYIGTFVVLDGDTVVTGYRCRPAKLKSILKRARKGGLK